MDGIPASEWIERMCEGRGIPFSAVHRHLETNSDQGVALPCCSSGPAGHERGDDGEATASVCPAISQWETFREGEFDVVIATHNFAHVPGVRTATNLVFDEEPDFARDLSKDRVAEAVTAYL
jgi:hypothetical protein